MRQAMKSEQPTEYEMCSVGPKEQRHVQHSTHRSATDFGFLLKVRVLHLKSCPEPPIQMYSAMILPFWGSLRNSASTSSESWVWEEKTVFTMVEFGLL